MNPDLEPMAGDRRTFLRRVALGGLAAVTATLLARGVGERCISAGICRGCAVYEDCALPQALSAKQALKPSK